MRDPSDRLALQMLGAPWPDLVPNIAEPKTSESIAVRDMINGLPNYPGISTRCRKDIVPNVNQYYRPF